MPCSGGCVHVKQFSREVPFADGYLVDPTQRGTAAGAQFKTVCNVSGLWTALHNGGRRFTASVCCGQDPLFGRLWSNVLLRSLGDDAVQCRSCGQPERTQEVMEVKMLLDGDGRRQKPHIP